MATTPTKKEEGDKPAEKKPPTTALRVLKACRERPTGVSAASVSRDLGLPLLEALSALVDHQNQGYLREANGVFYLTPAGQAESEGA